VTYNTYAVSNQDLVEVLIYEFNLGTTYHRYTSADRDITYGLDEHGDPAVYTAAAIEDDGTQSSGDTGDGITLTIDASLPPHQYLAGPPPSEEMWLTIRRLHYGDTDAPVYWVGTIDSSKMISDARAQMKGRLIGPSLKRGGLRHLWSRQCGNMLYAPECGVVKADYAVTITITALTATSITAVEIGGQDAGWFDGGFAEWTRPDGSMDRRMIQAGGTTDTVYTLSGTHGLEVGQEITLYPGCDLSYDGGCTKFSNTENYGGIRHLIEQSPFNGTRLM